MNSIAIYSDLICPWCYIGKRRLEEALRQLPRGSEVAVSWHPFQLNPDMPLRGLDRRMYRTKKFGSWERSQELDAQMVATAKSVGLEFRYDLQKNTPNTFDSHRLVWLAGVAGVQDAVVESLFRGYFCEGADFSDQKNLIEVGAAAGMDRTQLERSLAGDAGASEVREEEQRARELGLSGVPFFIINEAVAISGAQPPEAFLETLRRTSSAGDKSTEAAPVCGPEGCELPR